MTKLMRQKIPRVKMVFTFLVVFLIMLIAALMTEHKIREVTHPLKYAEYVEPYAAEYGVDALLVYSVIKTESGFQADAVSNVGARGLMQLMEPAFDWTKWRMGDESDICYDDLFDPELNVKYGTFMLSLLLDALGGEQEALAAYHAGLAQVQSWLADEQYSTDGKTLDSIPIKDTAHYVNKVMDAYQEYSDLYQNQITEVINGQTTE